MEVYYADEKEERKEEEEVVKDKEKKEWRIVIQPVLCRFYISFSEVGA